MQSLSRLPKQTFGQLIRTEREKQGLSHRDIAVRCGVDRATAKAWEDDQAVPDRFELKKLFGTCQRLRHYVHLLPATLGAQATSDAVADQNPLPSQLAPIAPPAPAPPKTFGEALRRARLHEGFTQEEVGELVDVSGQAVGAWETDKVAPIKEHLDRLLALFPLENAPLPDSQDIPKPVGGRGADRDPYVYNEQKQETPMQNPPISKPPTVAAPPVTPNAAHAIGAISAHPRPGLDKWALIRWGRLVHSLKSAENATQFTDFLAEAKDAGMTLAEVLEALREP